MGQQTPPKEGQTGTGPNGEQLIFSTEHGGFVSPEDYKMIQTVAQKGHIMGGLENAWNAVKAIPGEAKGGVIGGVLGLAAAPETGGASLLIPALSAFLGGSIGHTYDQPKNPDGTVDDPLETFMGGARQGGMELGGGLVGRGLKKLGAETYASGAGLNRPGFSRNFPTAAQEGLEGGKFTLPIITSGGAQRVLERTAPEKTALLAKAQNVPGPTAVDIARTGVKPILGEIRTGSPLPITDRSDAISYVKQFIDEHSKTTPPQRVLGNLPNNQGYGWQTLPGKSTPVEIPISDLEALKQGAQARATSALKSVNADNLPGLTPRLDRGVAVGAQKELEMRVPGLQEKNRQLQGLMGLNQSLNPSFRTPEELMGMGVDPSIAHAMTNVSGSNYSLPRIAGDVVAGLGGQAMGFNPITAAVLAHIGSSPLGRRLLGSGMYTLGRSAPILTQGAKLATPDLNKEALDKVIYADKR